MPKEQAQLCEEIVTGVTDDPLVELVLEATACASEPVAWRLYSRRLDREIWLARDADVARALDQDGGRGGLPMVLAADLEQLRALDDRRVNDLLDTLAAFPGARLADLEPEGGA
jgi:hypothetical protein